MKMGIGLFWGIVLIVIGLSIIFKVIFDISIFRIIIAIAFILIGVKILVGKSAINIKSDESDVIFNERNYNDFPMSDTEYNTVFGKSIFDFTKAKVPIDSPIRLEFNTIFGNTELRLPKDLPVKIKAESIFGSAKLPDNNTAVFGSASYISKHDSTANFVKIEASAVFGHIEIKQ